MILVKNKLKKIKNTIDDEEMLNYLKYSHLDTSKKTRIDLDTSKKTRIDKEDDIQLNNNLELANIEPKKVHTANKGVDTGNDFDEVIPPYVSFMHSEDFDRNEKMVQVWTKMFKENLTPSPPSSRRSSSSSSSSGSEGFPSKTTRMGFRLAEFALNTAIATTNVAEFLWNATSPPEYDINAEIDEEQEPQVTTEQSSSSTNVSIHRDRSRSRDGDSENLGDRLLQRGASRSRSNTPSSGTASSAKTTPRKKSK